MRLLNRWGQVKEIRFDNGSNFVAADKEIQELIMAMQHSKLKREFNQRGCNWAPPPPHCISYVRGMGEAGASCQEKLQSHSQ